VEEIEPKVKPLYFQLQKKYLDSSHRERLNDPRYTMLTRVWRPDVELFRDENVRCRPKSPRSTVSMTRPAAR
jgi:hypothetical protein